MTPGIHLVHKLAGPTSFSMVRERLDAEAADAARSGRRAMKICHGGTLDPFADGLLLILTGEATRLFDHLHAVPKVYDATIRWGVETDNGDPLGRIVRRCDLSGLSPERIEEAIQEFLGWREQVPPVTSARRVAGERAYLRAQRGETVDMPPVRVYLHEARWLDHQLSGDAPSSRLRITVRGGYYVRALGRDLGRRLGCTAHLSELRRLSIGPWNDPPPGETIEIRGRGLLPWLESRELTDQEVGELRAGRTIAQGAVAAAEWALAEGFPGDPDPPIRAFHRDRLAFLLRRENDGLRAIAQFRRGL